MPRMNGLEFAEAVQNKKIPVEIIVLTMHKEEQLFNRAMDLGIHGFVSKENAATEIAEGIRAVVEGNALCLFNVFKFPFSAEWLSVRHIQSMQPDSIFSQWQNEMCLRLIAENLSSKKIAEQLSISPKTVDNHRTNICSKLNIHGSHALLRFLLENKIFALDFIPVKTHSSMIGHHNLESYLGRFCDYFGDFCPIGKALYIIKMNTYGESAPK